MEQGAAERLIRSGWESSLRQVRSDSPARREQVENRERVPCGLSTVIRTPKAGSSGVGVGAARGQPLLSHGWGTREDSYSEAAAMDHILESREPQGKELKSLFMEQRCGLRSQVIQVTPGVTQVSNPESWKSLSSAHYPNHPNATNSY